MIILLLPLFLLGQLVRIPIGNVIITPLDLGIILLDLVLAVRIKTWLRIFLDLPWTKAYLLFVSVMVGSLLLALFLGESISFFALGQLVRILLYQGVLIGAIAFGCSSSWLSRAFLVFVLFGFIQLVFFPDLGFLAEWGWDPHYGRLVSTMLDPNFTSFILGIGVLYAISHRQMLAVFVCILGVIMTFSRSGTLALSVSLLASFFFFRQRSLLIVLVLFLLSSGVAFLLRGNLEGQRDIDRQASLESRGVSMSRALILIQSSPFFGVGFNRFRDESLEKGLIEEKDIVLHSAGGADNSLLFLWATTGVVGFAAFVWFAWSLVVWLWTRGGEARWWVVGATGWMVHAQAVNSLFFVPIVFVMLWWLGAVVSGRERDRTENRDAVARKV